MNRDLAVLRSAVAHFTAGVGSTASGSVRRQPHGRPIPAGSNSPGGGLVFQLMLKAFVSRVYDESTCVRF
jgi:hypothetical protein